MERRPRGAGCAVRSAGLRGPRRRGRVGTGRAGSRRGLRASPGGGGAAGAPGPGGRRGRAGGGAAAAPGVPRAAPPGAARPRPFVCGERPPSPPFVCAAGAPPGPSCPHGPGAVTGRSRPPPRTAAPLAAAPAPPLGAAAPRSAASILVQRSERGRGRNRAWAAPSLRGRFSAVRTDTQRGARLRTAQPLKNPDIPFNDFLGGFLHTFFTDVLGGSLLLFFPPIYIFFPDVERTSLPWSWLISQLSRSGWGAQELVLSAAFQYPSEKRWRSLISTDLCCMCTLKRRNLSFIKLYLGHLIEGGFWKHVLWSTECVSLQLPLFVKKMGSRTMLSSGRFHVRLCRCCLAVNSFM